MTFAAPNYAYLLFVLPIFALLKIAADHQAQKAVAAFVASERLRPSLLGGASMVWSGLHFGLQLLGLAFIIIALARPQYGIVENQLPQMGRNIFIAVDTSKSMLADDMAPNRLTRAKLAAQDLLEKLPGDRVGLVAFAGRAFLQAPLTTDHEAVRESIQALDHTTIPRGGSSLASAITLVLEVMEKSPGPRCGMVMFTDGQETDEGTLAAAKEAAAKHLLILPVGMGTAEGSLIPDPEPDRQGAYVKDERDNVVKTRLESALLQQVASTTGARYIELASQALTQSAVDSLLRQLDRQMADSRQESHPIERYQWPLGLGLFCIIVTMLMRPASRKLVRPPALPVDPQATVHAAPTAASFCLACVLLAGGMPSQVNAASVHDAQKAQEAYAKGNFTMAREMYGRLLKDKKPPANAEELQYGLAASAQQLSDHEAAVRAFSEALKSESPSLQSRAHRGLGTSLYDLGERKLAQEPGVTLKSWTDARDHFDNAMDVLRRHGKRDSAEFAENKENRDFVDQRIKELQKMIEMLQQQKQQGKPQEKQRGGKGEGDEDKNNEPSEGQKPEDNPGQPKKQHDQLQKGQQPLPEGQLHAMEGGQQKEKLTPAEEDQRNDKTGYTPQEARDQLRNYADDQKSAQFLMRKERPAGGKDY